MFTRLRSLVIGLGALALPGCYIGSGDSVFTDPTDIVERRAHSDLDCYDHLHVVASGGGSFTATGCGRRVSYVCTIDDVNGRLCMREGEIAAAAERSAAATPGIDRGRYIAELAAVSPEVERCLSRPELALQITLNASGAVTRIAGAIATAQEQECIEGVLARVRVVSVRTPAEVVTSFPPPRRDRSSVPTPPRRQASAPPSDLGAWVDARITENREAILACVGRSVIAVRVESDEAGVRWSLQGDLAGSPEQECVTSVMAAAAQPAPRGTAVRAVR